MRMLFFWLRYLLCPHDDKQRKPIMSPHATVGLVGTAKPLQCCHGALIKYLLVGLAIYGPYVGAGMRVSLLIPVTETDKELKLYFTVWISKSFGVHWWNLSTKLFLDGSSDLSLALWREFRETQGFCVPQHLGWYQVAEEGGGQAGHWVKHSCGKHQATPCGAQADAAPCFLQEQQAPGTSLREAAAQAGLQGAPWAETWWFSKWGSVRLPGQWACCDRRGIAELSEKGRILLKSVGVRAARKVLDALY